MVGIHMRDNVRLALGEGDGIFGEAQSGGLEPRKAPEPGDQVAAADRHPVQVKISEPGILRGARMPRGESREKPWIVAARRFAEKAEPRLGERIGQGMAARVAV